MGLYCQAHLRLYITVMFQPFIEAHKYLLNFSLVRNKRLQNNFLPLFYSQKF